MPNDLPPWHAVYDQVRRWLAAGCFEMLAHDLRAVLRLAAGRNEEPSAAVLDSRTLRSTPGSGARAAWHGYKRTRGSKIHLAVDTLGHLLALHVTPANENDRAAVDALAGAVQDTTGESVTLAYVDQATPASARQKQPARTASGRRWSNWLTPNAASCCSGAGSSSAALPGSHAAAGWQGTTNACPKRWPACTSQPSLYSCCIAPLFWPQTITASRTAPRN